MFYGTICQELAARGLRMAALAALLVKVACSFVALISRSSIWEVFFDMFYATVSSEAAARLV